MIYLKYTGLAPITNTAFGDFKKGELKIVPESETLVEVAKAMARTQPLDWRVINKQTHAENVIKNKLDKSQSYYEKNKIKGGKRR